VPTCSTRGPELTPSPFPLLFRQGGKVVRGAYLLYERTRASSLSVPSPVQVGREGGEGRLPEGLMDHGQLLLLFRWGRKVLSGAYLQYERPRASSLFIPSPV
jgi:hypothetical protein